MLTALRSASWRVLPLVALLLFLLFSRWLPHASLSALSADSSINVYMGQQINQGLVPYAEVWENKPPLIYWLNAFAIRFSPGSARGIVCLAYVFVFAYFAVAWAALRPRVGTYAAIFAVLTGLTVLPDVLISPNTTEVF